MNGDCGHAKRAAAYLQDEQRTLEQMMAKRSGLQQKKGTWRRRIREMGTLPADAFEKYRDRSPKELHKLLHKCQGQLSKYGCALPSLAVASNATGTPSLSVSDLGVTGVKLPVHFPLLPDLDLP